MLIKIYLNYKTAGSNFQFVFQGQFKRKDDEISPYALSTLWLSKVKVPGIDLPDDELWQMDEREVMTFDDYEKIVETGYGPWVEDFMKNRIGDPLPKMLPYIQSSPETLQRHSKRTGTDASQ